MSQPLCPHGNYDTTCPLCENVWDERSPLAPREAPWHEKEGVVPEAPAHTTKKDVPDAEPKPTPCASCKNPLDDNGRCDNLVCASKFKKKKETAAERGYPIPGDGRDDYIQAPTEAPPVPRRMKSPFSFGAAILEVTPTSLYDSVIIDKDAPNVFTRLFTDPAGKRDADISPHIGHGGQLPAPRMFVMNHLRCFLTPQTFYQDARREQFDRDQLITNAMVQFTIGVRYYFQGLLAMLPKDFPNKLAIPPQQCFYANVSLSGLAPLDHNWKLMMVLDGELGTEVN